MVRRKGSGRRLRNQVGFVWLFALSTRRREWPVMVRAGALHYLIQAFYREVTKTLKRLKSAAIYAMTSLDYAPMHAGNATIFSEQRDGLRT
jgi:hypothetical protein